MATIIRGTGEVEELEYEGAEPGLELLQKTVGGPIQLIQLRDGRYMAMHEEEKFKPLHHLNELATAMTRDIGLLPGDYIAGTVVILNDDEIS